jgi:predicted CoA-binding protein
MQRHGYRIMPVNPHLTEALEERAYENLRSISDPVEIVNIFRRPEHIPPLVEEAVEIGAQVVWMQLGIQHPEAAQRATEAGLTVVQDRCLRVEHQRLLLLA